MVAALRRSTVLAGETLTQRRARRWSTRRYAPTRERRSDQICVRSSIVPALLRGSAMVDALRRSTALAGETLRQRRARCWSARRYVPTRERRNDQVCARSSIVPALLRGNAMVDVLRRSTVLAGEALTRRRARRWSAQRYVPTRERRNDHAPGAGESANQKRCRGSQTIIAPQNTVSHIQNHMKRRWRRSGALSACSGRGMPQLSHSACLGGFCCWQ